MKMLLSLLIFLSAHMGYAQNSDEAVHVASVLADRPKGITTDQMICLGEGWEEVNFNIAMRLERIKSDYPNLFRDLGDKQRNCFVPEEVPSNAYRNFDELLNLIDKIAKDQFYASVDDSGSLAIDKNKEAPLKYQKDPMGKKLLRAEALIAGVQIGTMGFLAALPESVTNWDRSEWRQAGNYLVRAWTTPPVMDKDAWWMNGVVHPLAGALYYNSLRSQGATRLQAFVFSTVQSTLWEYGFEALAEQPSIQDLILTPLVGSLIGELSHMATMRMRENGFNLGEKIILTIINPAYVVMNGYKLEERR